MLRQLALDCHGVSRLYHVTLCAFEVHSQKQEVKTLIMSLRQQCWFPWKLSTAQLTDLSCGNDVLVFRVLVDGQTEDVVSVFQVEALGSCRDRKQEA